MKEQHLNVNVQFLKAYDDLADPIYRHCYYRVSDRERARDIMQETFTRTWEYISRNGHIDNLRAFLYRTAHNLIVDEYRKKKMDSLDELRDKGFDPIGADFQKDIHTAIAAREIIALFDKIDLSYREVLVMRYIDDMAPKEIAHVLDESENAISVRLHRAIKKIKELMEHREKTI